MHSGYPFAVIRRYHPRYGWRRLNRMLALPRSENGHAHEPGSAARQTADATAKLIAASAEAKALPALALAAIRAKLTLEQFKGQVAAALSLPRASRLDAAMANAKRLGPDGASGADGQGRITNALTDRAAARRGQV